MKLVEAILETPQFISPAKVLTDLGLKSGMNVIDYACGAGHWSAYAAKIVAPGGKVLAIENNIDMLNLVRSKAELQGITNIDVEEIELEKGISKKAKPADIVIVSNILHLIKDKQLFVNKATKMVKKDGKLLFIDWVPRKTLFGPPVEMRVSEEGVMELFEKAGLHFACTVMAGVDHFGLIFDYKGEGCDWEKSTTE